MLTRRSLIQTFGAATMAGLLMTSGAAAQSYPTQPVTLVVPYAPGGPTDLMARLVAQRLSDRWGQPVVVENRPGASGTLGSEYVARAEADGYTLVLANNAAQGSYELLNPSTTPYHTLTDFAPVAMIGSAPLVMIVSTNVGATTLPDFVTWAQAHAGEVNYASAAIGSATQMAAEMLTASSNLDMEMIVFQGGAPALQSVVAGETDMYMGGYSTVSAQVDAGTVNAVGVAAATRLSGAPDLPTFSEQGFDIVYGSWFGLMAPASVPAEILDQINADVNEALADEESLVSLANYGIERDLMDRDAFRALLEARIEQDRGLIEAAGIATN